MPRPIESFQFTHELRHPSRTSSGDGGAVAGALVSIGFVISFYFMGQFMATLLSIPVWGGLILVFIGLPTCTLFYISMIVHVHDRLSESQGTLERLYSVAQEPEALATSSIDRYFLKFLCRAVRRERFLLKFGIFWLAAAPIASTLVLVLVLG